MGDSPTGGAALAPVPGEARVRLPVAVLALVATVVVALLAVALAVRLDTATLPSGPPRDPPAAPAEATRLTVDGDQVGYDEFRVTLPGAPYGCGQVTSPPRGLTQVEACTTTVHRDYDGKGSDWVAVVGVGLVDGSRVVPDDLATTTAAVFDDVVALSYATADHPRLFAADHGPAEVAAPPGAAYTQSARVAVRHPGLATPYDKLVVIVVRLENGRHVAVFSDFPHDGSTEALNGVVAAVSSIRAQR